MSDANSIGRLACGSSSAAFAPIPPAMRVQRAIRGWPRQPWTVVGLAALVCVPHAAAQGSGPTKTATLKALSLEELMDVEVTSVSRNEERATEAAAAVHVITEEDIRRSGARSIPEALRLAPNLQVAQATGRNWAISARGFNATFTNKLLVLIDGRSVYDPLFSGVFWDAQDTLLEDVDRIEVISGPGATAWGANAVNGVINIITKSARQTQGILVTAGSGTEERGVGGFRYGGRRGADLHYRFYAKGFARDDSVLPTGDGAEDGWYTGQAGFRLDREPARGDRFTLQGDVYDGRLDQGTSPDISRSGGNLLARWTRKLGKTEQLQVQTYYDRKHQFVPGEFGDTLDTFDVDVQYERDIDLRHHLMVGSGYRFTHDRVDNLPESLAFLPASLDRQLVSVFAQDQITVTPRTRLTVGSKIEHNDYTGFEVQPSARVVWTNRRHVLWSAVSRAVRMPSRFDRHLFFPANPPFLFAGGPEFVSEELLAYELGWRVRPTERVFLSFATFFDDYDNIRSTSLGPPFVTENNVEGEIAGIEIEGTWQVTERWRLAGGYTGLTEDLRVKPGREDRNQAQGETFDPPHQAQLRSSFTLRHDIELDAWLRYVDRVGSTGRGFGVVPDYVTLDARIGWSPVPRLQLAIVGQHLLDDRHPEFATREIERSVYGKATWRF